MADQDLVNGLSKLVGYSIVLPAFFVLIPQILKVWEAGSGEGLSIPLQAQELAMLVIGSCYNWRIGLPLNAWGEAFPVGVQCLILLLLLVHFSPQSDKTVHVFLAFLGILIFCALIPLDLLWICTLPGLVLGIGAAMSRVLSNYQRGHTGQMSLITAGMNAAGLVVRTFTTLVENGQSVVAVTSVIIALTLNTVILAQVYQTHRSKVLQEKEK